MMFRRFEGIVEPYPDALPPPPPRRFAAFMWDCTRGVRRLLLAATLVSAAIGSFEALLFAMMAHILDALAQTPPAELWARHGATLPPVSYTHLRAPPAVLTSVFTLLPYKNTQPTVNSCTHTD